MKGFDQGGVVGRTSAEENLAFAEETFYACMMRVGIENAAGDSLTWNEKE